MHYSLTLDPGSRIRDPGSGMKKFRIRDPEKTSRIRNSNNYIYSTVQIEPTVLYTVGKTLGQQCDYPALDKVEYMTDGLTWRSIYRPAGKKTALTAGLISKE
jgi:hypothetical protein